MDNCRAKESKQKAALKARLRRLCEEKKGGKCNVPDWLHQMWKNGDHLQMALDFQAAGFDKEPKFMKISLVPFSLKIAKLPWVILRPTIRFPAHCRLVARSRSAGPLHEEMRVEHNRNRKAEEHGCSGLVLKGGYEKPAEMKLETCYANIFRNHRVYNVLYQQLCNHNATHHSENHMLQRIFLHNYLSFKILWVSQYCSHSRPGSPSKEEDRGGHPGLHARPSQPCEAISAQWDILAWAWHGFIRLACNVILSLWFILIDWSMSK